MKIRDLRAVYNALRSIDRVANHLPPCVVYEETDFGELAIDRSALVALDLDNLFSGRHTGEAVEAAVLRAIHEAADAADPEAPVVYVTVRFGTLHTARLVMRQTGEGVCVLAA